MFFNALLLLSHIGLICALSIGALRLGKEAMTAWLALLAVLMNLFVTKQIALLGLNVTATDALAVGYLLNLNFMQEFHGKEAARRTVWITFFITAGFILLSLLHLLYTPNVFDMTQNHFAALLLPMPRIILASILSFLTVQLIDIRFFALLRSKWEGKRFPLRTFLSLFLSQTLDTLLFTFLALYGLVGSLLDIILLSLLVKAIVIACTTPVTLFAKRMRHVQV